MALRLNGQTTGYTELNAPANGDSVILTMPGTDGNAGQYLQTDGSGTLSWQTVATPTDTNLTRGTAISLSGNTAVTFSSIPSDAKRIVISVSQYSSTQSAYPKIRLGYNSGTFQTTGYEFYSQYTSSYYSATNDGYFYIYHLNNASTFYGHIVLTNPTGNTWVQTHTGGSYGWNSAHWGGGYVDLLGTLDTIEFSCHTGTMDSGTVNIFYEV